jgi:Protein of unknown function (DUF1501)
MARCDWLSREDRLMRSELDRRKFLASTGPGLIGLLASRQFWPETVRAADKRTPRATARFCIFLETSGGVSQVDTFDFKEGRWTPDDFAVQRINSDIQLSQTLLPRLSQQIGRFAIVRSMYSQESVHFRAQYYLQTGHIPNLALFREVPPVGSVVAYEYDARRKDGDAFPPYVSINLMKSGPGALTSGFLPARYSVLNLETDVGVDGIALNDQAREMIARRWELLLELEGSLRGSRSPRGRPFIDYGDLYKAAYTMLQDDRAPKAFSLAEEDRKRYGSSLIGDGCLMARNLVAADAGTHYVHVVHPGWDHHWNIYDKKADKNHYKLCNQLDAALASLIEDLAKTSSQRSPGKTLLDETLVVCMGEFGRIAGDVNLVKGRDHQPQAFSALFAGGGVKAGRVIGSTDSIGGKIADFGWSKKSPISIENVVATIYSALGIEWGKIIEKGFAGPLARPFNYVDPAVGVNVMVDTDEIKELFA